MPDTIFNQFYLYEDIIQYKYFYLFNNLIFIINLKLFIYDPLNH